jgi:hypothetical protein
VSQIVPTADLVRQARDAACRKDVPNPVSDLLIMLARRLEYLDDREDRFRHKGGGA